MISALEYGAEFAFGPRESSPYEWEEYEKVRQALMARGIDPEAIVDWVRGDSALDLWHPVVK